MTRCQASTFLTRIPNFIEAHLFTKPWGLFKTCLVDNNMFPVAFIASSSRLCALRSSLGMGCRCHAVRHWCPHMSCKHNAYNTGDETVARMVLGELGGRKARSCCHGAVQNVCFGPWMLAGVRFAARVLVRRVEIGRAHV